MSIKNKSKRLAYLLRHDRKYQFDVNGWREVSDLINKHGFTLEDLCAIVDQRTSVLLFTYLFIL